MAFSRAGLPEPGGSHHFFDAMKNIISFLLISMLAACSSKTYQQPHVMIYTEAGDIELELYPDKAPKSVAAFLSYVDSGYYTHSSFYRVLSLDNQPMGTAATQLIQGGVWATRPQRDSLPGIPHESTQQTGLLHENGTVSLARLAPGTATTEFFICIDKQPGFDYGGAANPDGQGYAAFGKVVSGMEVVFKIYQKPEENQYFSPPVRISKITRL